jgi:quinol monooxygenase YgiN
MSPPVLIGFAGVLVAAVATGMLAGRCVRQPRIDFVLWTAATLGLTIALVAQSMGFASGFGPATFRAIQLFALLLAPLWLAWGLVELVVPNEAARFGMRLIASALTVVASVILATDPLSAQPFSKAWPLTGSHFQPISQLALDVLQVFAVVAVLACVVVAVLTSAGPARGRVMAAVVPVGLAALITAGLRFALPAGAAYPLLSMLAAALVWFGASRAGKPAWQASRGGRGDGVADGGGRYRPDDDYGRHGSAGDHASDAQYVTYGQRGGPSGAGPGAGPGRQGPPPRVPPDRYRGSGPEAARGPGPDLARGPESARGPGPEAAREAARGAGPSAAEFGAQAAAAATAAAPARPYGRILIFTLLEDRVADFDRLAEQSAEEVRTGEPDTLVYVIHLVPNAPLQRIFYEIYRDRAAFESHESQPYMQRFVAERRSCVLATNVIELRLKYAKVAPLPNPQAPAPAPPGPAPAAGPPARTQPPAGPPRRLQPLPPGVPGAPGRPSRPYPPPRPDQPRYDQPRYDQPRPDQPRPDQRRPDQRQVPSAGQRYDGG